MGVYSLEKRTYLTMFMRRSQASSFDEQARRNLPFHSEPRSSANTLLVRTEAFSTIQQPGDKVVSEEQASTKLCSPLRLTVLSLPIHPVPFSASCAIPSRWSKDETMPLVEAATAR
jgi:hypothetical protein